MGALTSDEGRQTQFDNFPHDAWMHVDGLRYRSSMHGAGIAYVLFERCRPALPGNPVFDLPLDHPRLDSAIRRVGAEIGYRVL